MARLSLRVPQAPRPRGSTKPHKESVIAQSAYATGTPQEKNQLVSEPSYCGPAVDHAVDLAAIVFSFTTLPFRCRPPKRTPPARSSPLPAPQASSAAPSGTPPAPSSGAELSGLVQATHLFSARSGGQPKAGVDVRSSLRFPGEEEELTQVHRRDPSS